MAERRRKRKQRQGERPPSGTHGRATRTILILFALALAVGVVWWIFAGRSQESTSVSAAATFQPTVENGGRAQGEPPASMAGIPGGEFSTGAAELERTARDVDFPDAPQDNFVAGAVVFSPLGHPVPLNDHLREDAVTRR